jgi:hypothetical protein
MVVLRTERHQQAVHVAGYVRLEADEARCVGSLDQGFESPRKHCWELTFMYTCNTVPAVKELQIKLYMPEFYEYFDAFIRFN